MVQYAIDYLIILVRVTDHVLRSHFIIFFLYDLTMVGESSKIYLQRRYLSLSIIFFTLNSLIFGKKTS